MDKTNDENRIATPVRYELVISAKEARLGTKKILSRHGKKLEVNVPGGVKDGSTIKLPNALHVTDGQQGDILIVMKVKKTKATTGVIEASDSNFHENVLQSEMPALVDFWAPWCGPCKMIAPVIAKLAEEYQDRINFFKLNVDENGIMSSKYQVMSIPMLLFFKEGQVIDKIVGAASESAIRSKIESMI